MDLGKPCQASPLGGNLGAPHMALIPEWAFATPWPCAAMDGRCVPFFVQANGVNLVKVGIDPHTRVDAADREEDAAGTESLTASQGRIWKMLNHLKNGTTDEYEQVVAVQPGEFTDPAIAARERELVFGRVPSIVCHGSEIARPGDFLTVQMPRNKVLVVRQRDGS